MTEALVDNDSQESLNITEKMTSDSDRNADQEPECSSIELEFTTEDYEKTRDVSPLKDDSPDITKMCVSVNDYDNSTADEGKFPLQLTVSLLLM